MKIDCYLSKGYAAENVLRENIHQALVKEAVNADVNFYRISESDNVLIISGTPHSIRNLRSACLMKDLTNFQSPSKY